MAVRQLKSLRTTALEEISVAIWIPSKVRKAVTRCATISSSKSNLLDLLSYIELISVEPKGAKRLVIDINHFQPFYSPCKDLFLPHIGRFLNLFRYLVGLLRTSDPTEY
jgi:hypothetical protein